MVRGPQWSDEEDVLLLQGVRTHGNKWRVISDLVLPSRSPSSLRYRWHVICETYQSAHLHVVEHKAVVPSASTHPSGCQVNVFYLCACTDHLLVSGLACHRADFVNELCRGSNDWLGRTPLASVASRSGLTSGRYPCA